MAKRQLSEQQKRRIAARHDQLVSTPSGEELTGLVIAHRGKQLEIESSHHETFICHARQNLGSVVAGDRVRWCKETETTGIVIAREERTSALTRPDVYKQEKTIAANIDQMVILIAADSEPIWHFVDKYIVAAELQGYCALLVLNKTDLQANLPPLQQRLDVYRGLGYPCYEISCQTKMGITELQQALANKTSIFVGQSGAGKSSLVNALLHQDIAKIGDISEANNKGQHTTTTARLYHFLHGGDLIDSPGIREFGLWHISKEEALRGYKEIYAFASLCKFRDCQHKNTKGCAIEAAIAAGKISAERLQSYLRVIDTLTS